MYPCLNNSKEDLEQAFHCREIPDFVLSPVWGYRGKDTHSSEEKLGLKALLHCEMFRATCLAMFWQHCGGTRCMKHFSVTYPATAKIVARQVSRKVAPNSTFSNGSCNLTRNDFGRCMVCYTVKCFLQLVSSQCRQNIARQVARNISQRNSAFRVPLAAT